MSVPQAQLDRVIASAKVFETQGYFERVRAGDKKASGLFVRLVALDVNPHGDPNDWGWLTKVPPETNVDGFGEDSICFTSDPNNLLNVCDLVNGAGAPGASIGGGIKERRPTNKWFKPEPLTPWELAYLRAGGAPPQPEPVPPPQPTYPPYPGDEVWDAMGEVLFADYARANKLRPDDPNTKPNPGMSRWFGRVEYDWLVKNVPTLQDAINKQRPNWCAALGIPVQ